MARDYRAHVGDLVLVHDPKLAAQISQESRVGLVIQTRRGGARVSFLPGRENYWIEEHRLIDAPKEMADQAGVIAVAAKGLHLLKPELVEIEAAEESQLEIHCQCIRLEQGDAAALVEALGSALRGWEVVPYGMAVFTVILKLEG